LHNSSDQIVQEADRLYRNRAQIAQVSQSIELLVKAPVGYEIAWRLGRAFFFLGQESCERGTARGFHIRGAAACRQALRIRRDHVAGHFWRGVNLALLAQSEPAPKSALHALQARRALERAIIIDPAYHAAGPHRVLARLQQKLPRLLGGGLIAAQGNFERAISLAPTNTVTRIYLAELLAEAGNAVRARFELEQILNAPFDEEWAFEIERDRLRASEMLAAE